MIRTLSTILAGWLLVTYYGGTIAAQHADLSQRKACVPDRFAVEAMRLVRALPPPPDPADTLVQVITDELRRQAEEPQATQYVSAGLSDAVMLDGTFDLRQLAQAILKSGVLTL